MSGDEGGEDEIHEQESYEQRHSKQEVFSNCGNSIQDEDDDISGDESHQDDQERSERDQMSQGEAHHSQRHSRMDHSQ